MPTSAPTAPTSIQLINLSAIRHDQNVRNTLADDEIQALAQSISLLGQLTPITVRVDPENPDGYLLIAGHKRYAAHQHLGRETIRAEIRTHEDRDTADAAEAAERAAENIVRSGLNPHEEAVAVQAMRARGLSDDGVAQALGWSKARVTARLKLLDLPETAQKMIGAGTLPLAAIESLRSIGAVSRDVQDCVIGHLAGDRNAAERFAREPGWIVTQALRGEDGAFGAVLDSTSGYEIAELKLGKRATAHYEQICELNKKLDRYAYMSPQVPFDDSDIDQARAAGVLLELGTRAPIIVDRNLYRELVKQALKRHAQTLTDKVARQADERKAAKRTGGDQTQLDPVVVAKREHGRDMRDLAYRGHAVNTELGWKLRDGLSAVDPTDMDVARFFVYSVLGPEPSPYGNHGDLVAELAMTGIRLVIEEFRTDVTTTKKNGERGVTRFSYGEPTKREPAITWLFKYVDAAKTAGELYGRALVVIAAQRYAVRAVVPVSQQHPALRFSSHQDKATKALAKLAGPHLPASYTQLQKAITKAKAEHDRNVAQLESAKRQAVAAAQDAEETDVDDVDLEDSGIDQL